VKTLKSIDGTVKKIKSEISKAVVGQDDIVELLLTTVFAGGHAILEGVPGLAKTLLINSLARTLDLGFNRIQFTPDLIPSDVTGTEIIDVAGTGEKSFRFMKGPVFSNILLADEINRTPPKTQSALLQAMQERKVTVLGNTYDLPEPFFVFATQNPIEYEGTYPLPEAQLDRFLLLIRIGYPTEKEEMEIVTTNPEDAEKIKPVIDRKEILSIIESSAGIAVSDKVKKYAVGIARNTRPDTTNVELVKRSVRWGAGPRASQMLIRASQSHALIRGRKLVEKEDVDRMLLPVLAHRIVLNYQTAAGEVSAESVLKEIKKHSEAKL
jgi:MoxR-like ATPase